MCLIKFDNFSFRYKKNDFYQLENINLEIKENKFILLAGATGSGKTSLIRSMNGLIPQFYAGFYKGGVIINGKNSVETEIMELSKDVGIVFQNPENQLISMDVEHEIAFGMENIGIPREEMVKRIDEVVKIVEIEHLMDKAPFELSGGEQQRVAIASILVLDPKVLILDEPTALLDPAMAQKIINLLKKIQTEKKKTIIISEHRMDLVIPYVDEIILLDKGKIIEHDTKNAVINGKNFETININKPIIYSICLQLKNKGFFPQKYPVSVQEFIELFKYFN